MSGSGDEEEGGMEGSIGSPNAKTPSKAADLSSKAKTPLKTPLRDLVDPGTAENQKRKSIKKKKKPKTLEEMREAAMQDIFKFYAR